MNDPAAARSDIEKALRRYEAALNSANVDAVLGMFTDDGVFMAPNRPATTGKTAIRAAYESIFQVIAFDTTLTIEEVVPVAADWAFARTSSNGSVTVKANAQKVHDANHELFVLQRGGDDAWRIARYSFATTSPAQ